MTQLPTPYRFRVSDYHEMSRAGILTEDDRVELLEGVIVAMRPIGSRHAYCVFHLTELFNTLGAGPVNVWSQNPILLGDYSEPQPDIAILQRRPSARELPKATDVLLVIEVADSSAGYDRSTKGRLYADAGIPEYWIVDLTADRVVVFREPRSGGYGVVRSARRGESVAPVNIPDIALSVDDIVG